MLNPLHLTYILSISLGSIYHSLQVESDGIDCRMSNYNTVELGTPLDTGPARPYVYLPN